MIADDGFAGAGGWDLGAQALGITARGIENMKEARATRDAAGLVTIHDDVWTHRPDGKAIGRIDSPPCQTFSTAGKGAGRRALEDVLRGIRDRYYLDLDHLRFLGEEVGDQRTALVLTPLHFATAHEYEWLAWEQVPTVLPVWEACAEVLRAAGWNVWVGLLHAEQYGVPQTRKRAFLLASRRQVVSPPAPTHSRYYSRDPKRIDAGLLPWVSMAEALVPLGWPESFVMTSNYGTGGDATRRGLRRADQPAPTITSKVDRNTIQVAWSLRSNQRPAGGVTRIDANGYALRSASEPAMTVTGNVKSYQWSPTSVRVTVAEAGVLQSFPADHPWQGKQGKRYLQVGNAVPPLLAMHALGAAAGIDAREVAA